MIDFRNKREELIKLTRMSISSSISPDTMIIQAMNTIDDLTKQLNLLVKRLREWHAYSLPEFEKKVSDHERYAILIAEKSYEELTKEFAPNGTMGNVLDEADLAMQVIFAKRITSMYELKGELLDYIEKIMRKEMPNVQKMAGTSIGARLLVTAGSIRKLAVLPASTIQMLGAEKALFRHIKTGARPPKHGFIINHPFVQSAGRNKGKAARILADKLSHCARLDFFKGEFLADKYLEDLYKKKF